MKNKKKLLLACVMYFVCSIFIMSLPQNAYKAKAEEKKIKIIGDFFETKKNNDTCWGNEDNILGNTDKYKTLGEMYITGELAPAEVVDDAEAFIVDGDKFSINYPISKDRIAIADETKWHVSQSNGYAISVYTSFDNEDYLNELFINERDFSDLQGKPIYQGKDIDSERFDHSAR